MSEKPLFEDIKQELIAQNREPEEIEQIEKAYLFAKRLHEGQYRISEEPYIIHPVEVAKILVGLKVDSHTLQAAFLHDILEDTDTQPEEIEKLFGKDVLTLVQGVTKLGKLQFKSKEERQAENFRRLFIAMASDIRIVFLKLADRLHNMRTLNFMITSKQQKIARETLDIFAPLANRLGIYKIKAELEDLSLRYLEPDKYFEIARLVSQTKASREETVKILIDKITADVKKAGINAQITGRAKHYYSIYSKMKRLNIAFHDLYDITAVRVIVDTEKECYEVLGLIHSQFKPIPGRFKDYIAMPKGNMYQSLHTSVIGPRSKPLEVQLDKKVEITSDLKAAISDADIILSVVATSGTRDVCEKLKEAGIKSEQILVNASKGIELPSLMRMSQVIKDVLPEQKLAILSGPTLAKEVLAGLPTAASVACEDIKTAEFVQKALNVPSKFRLYTNTDVIGVELGGSLKNVIAIASGFAHTMGLGDNCAGTLLTRGMAEIVRVSITLGANPSTLYGLSGMGDLIATCSSPMSRNYTVGSMLAKGKKIDDILNELGSVAEGVKTSKAICELAKKLNIEVPVSNAIYEAVYTDITPQALLEKLMNRKLKEEERYL